MISTCRVIVLASIVFLIWWNDAIAGDESRERVFSILERRCLSCHSEEQRKGDFSLQTAASTLASGYLEPGDANTSYLMRMIVPANGKAQMPEGFRSAVER